MSATALFSLLWSDGWLYMHNIDLWPGVDGCHTAGISCSDTQCGLTGSLQLMALLRKASI